MARETYDIERYHTPTIVVERLDGRGIENPFLPGEGPPKGLEQILYPLVSNMAPRQTQTIQTGQNQDKFRKGTLV